MSYVIEKIPSESIEKLLTDSKFHKSVNLSLVNLMGIDRFPEAWVVDKEVQSYLLFIPQYVVGMDSRLTYMFSVGGEVHAVTIDGMFDPRIHEVHPMVPAGAQRKEFIRQLHAAFRANGMGIEERDGNPVSIGGECLPYFSSEE